MAPAATRRFPTGAAGVNLNPVSVTLIGVFAIIMVVVLAAALADKNSGS